MFKFKRYLLVLVVISFLLSCSKYQKILKSPDASVKYDAAIAYYNKKDYFRALPLLEELVNLYKGTQKAEKVYYYFAYTNYGLGDYATANFHFDNFTKTYPNSEYTEECYYMSAYCSYLDSPVSSLDPTNTIKAINELQLFVNKYPNSSRIPECNRLIDELRFKLEKKAFDNAKLFYNLEDYKAAIVSFKNVIKDYPDTRFAEESMFLIMKTYYLYAGKSVEEKKEERYKAVVEAYLPFIDTYPKSKYLREAESMYVAAQKELKKLKS